MYNKAFENAKNIVITYIPNGYKHVFHVYSIRIKSRKKIIQYLKQNNIPSGVYYQLPLHLQPANKYLGYKKGQFPIAEKVSGEVLALPLHPSLEKSDVNKIIRLVKGACSG